MSRSAGYYRQDDDDVFDDDLEEGEEDGQGGHIRSSNDHNILLIDARPNMFEPMDAAGDVSFVFLFLLTLSYFVEMEGLRLC